MKRYLYIIILLTASGIAPAQSISNEITKINHYYNTKLPLEVQYSYQLFMSEQAAAKEQQFVTLYQEGKKQYVKYDKLESIATPEYNLYVDHASKQIILTKGPTPFGEQKDPAAGLTETITKMLSYCTDTSLSKKGSIGNIELGCETSQFDKIIVQYNTKDYSLKKLVLQMRKNDLMEENIHPRIVVAYSKVEKGGVLPPNIFSYAQFLIKNTAGELVLNEAMKGYTFSNYLQ